MVCDSVKFLENRIYYIDYHNGSNNNFVLLNFWCAQWKAVVSDFRKGMSVKKRRMGRQSYCSSFTGPEAIAWLHSHLQTSHLIKNAVSRNQVCKYICVCLCMFMCVYVYILTSWK